MFVNGEEIMSKVLAMFPGQGSQKVGMGKALFDKYEVAREMFAQADKALGFALSELCFNGPSEKLTQTAITQPAILTVSSIYYRIWKDGEGKDENIVAALGHSLGEYSALVAAGAIKFEDAVLIVHKRGSYMQEAVPAGKGKMVAVLNKEPAEIDAAIKTVESGVVEMANINAPGQIVVSGEATAVDAFVSALGKAKVIELAVSAPFHCRLMQPAAEKLAVDLKALQISKPAFPVISNFSAEYSLDPELIRASLESQVCGRVRWVESIERAVSEFTPDCSFEFGEGAVLSGMLKKINPSVERKIALDNE